MKRMIFLFPMLLALVFTSYGQVQPGLTAEKRAQHLSDKMIEDLRLNNYQSRRLRDLNLDLMNKIIAIETKYANNAVLTEEKYQDAYRERNAKLEKFLSTDQFSQFYGTRNYFYKLDKEFAAKAGTQQLDVKHDPSGKGLEVDQKPATNEAGPKK